MKVPRSLSRCAFLIVVVSVAFLVAVEDPGRGGLQAFASGETTRKELLQSWKSDIRRAGIMAIQEDRLHVIDDSLVSIPGPRMVRTAEQIAAWLYPERFQIRP